MIFQKLNANDAEKIFMLFMNVQGATLSAGTVVRLDTSTADGVRVSQPTTATFSLMVGVTNDAVSDSGMVKVQVYGYRSSAYVINDQTTAIAAGDLLIPVNGQNYLARGAAGNGAVIGGSNMIVALEAFATATTPAAATKKVFIRCM